MFNKDDIGSDGDIKGYVGKGMTMEGTMKFDGTVRVDGHFKGEVISSGTFIAGEGALIEAKVNAGSIVVSGEIRGTLEAEKRVELKSPGKVVGDIITPTLIIGEGVIFEGNCVMTKKTSPDLKAISSDEGAAEETGV